ncbi:MAG: hypothetical protein AAGG47_10515 [Pseudomonadota bacterium]
MIATARRNVLGQVAALLAMLTLAQGVAVIPLTSAAAAGVTGVWTVLCSGGQLVFIPLGGDAEEPPHSVHCPIAALGPVSDAASPSTNFAVSWAPYRPTGLRLSPSVFVAFAAGAMPRGPPRA